MPDKAYNSRVRDAIFVKNGPHPYLDRPYTGRGVRGGSDEPLFRLGSYVIDSHIARLVLNSRGEIAAQRSKAET